VDGGLWPLGLGGGYGTAHGGHCFADPQHGCDVGHGLDVRLAVGRANCLGRFFFIRPAGLWPVPLAGAIRSTVDRRGGGVAAGGGPLLAARWLVGRRFTLDPCFTGGGGLSGRAGADALAGVCFRPGLRVVAARFCLCWHRSSGGIQPRLGHGSQCRDARADVGPDVETFG